MDMVSVTKGSEFLIGLTNDLKLAFLLMQFWEPDPTNPMFWFAALALGGLAFLFLSIIVGIPITYLHRRRIRNQGRAAGVEVDFKVKTPKLDACTGSVECIGCIAIIAVGIMAAIGIAFPIQLSASAEENLIIIVVIAAGVLLGIVTPLLISYGLIWDLRNQRRALRLALNQKEGASPTPTKGQIVVCPTCGKRTRKGGKYCAHCGAALDIS